MAFVDLMSDWVDQFEDPQVLLSWISPDVYAKYEAQGRAGLTEIGRHVVKSFFDHHALSLPRVLEYYPEFAQWYKTEGLTLINDTLKRLSVRSDQQLVDLVGVAHYCKYLLDSADSPETLWYWAADTLGQLYHGFEALGVLPEMFIRLDFESSAPPAESTSFVLQPAGASPAGSSPL